MGNCTEVHRVCHRVTQRDVVTNDRTYLRLSAFFICADLREKSRKSEEGRRKIRLLLIEHYQKLATCNMQQEERA